MPRKTAETYPPFFLGHFLSGSDNGRDTLIKARSGLPWLSRYLALSRDSRTIFRRDFVVGSDSRSGLIMGDFAIPVSTLMGGNRCGYSSTRYRPDRPPPHNKKNNQDTDNCNNSYSD